MNNPDQWNIPEETIPFVKRLRPELQALALDNDGRLPSVHKGGQPLIYWDDLNDPLCPECANRRDGMEGWEPVSFAVNQDEGNKCYNCAVLVQGGNQPDPSEPWEDD